MNHGEIFSQNKRNNGHHLLSIYHILGTVVRALIYVSFNLHSNPRRKAFSLTLSVDKETELPIEEWLNMLWYIPTLEYYTALKIIFSKILCARDYSESYIRINFSISNMPLEKNVPKC